MAECDTKKGAVLGDEVELGGVAYVRKDKAPRAVPLSKLKLKQAQYHPYEVGQRYYIQTVTHFYIGRLLAVTDGELMVDEAAWIADTGRFAQFMACADPLESESFLKEDRIIISRGAVVMAVKKDKHPITK